MSARFLNRGILRWSRRDRIVPVLVARFQRGRCNGRFSRPRRQWAEQQLAHGVVQRHQKMRKHIHPDKAVDFIQSALAVEYTHRAILELKIPDADGIGIRGIAELVSLIAHACHLRL